MTKIKSINISKDEVFITETRYGRWRCEPLTEILRKQGKAEAIKEILQYYWDKNFQTGSENIYSRVVSSFKENNPNFNWDTVGYIKGEYKYSYEELKKKLYDSYLKEKNKPIVRGNFIIKLGNSYILQLDRNGASTTSSEGCAKIFKYTKACDVMRRFKNSNPELIKIEN